MADYKQVTLLNENPDRWNEWRKRNPEIKPDLSQAYLKGLHGDEIDLSNANLEGADLREVFLPRGNLSGARLNNANLMSAFLLSLGATPAPQVSPSQRSTAGRMLRVRKLSGFISTRCRASQSQTKST